MQMSHLHVDGNLINTIVGLHFTQFMLTLDGVSSSKFICLHYKIEVIKSCDRNSIFSQVALVNTIYFRFLTKRE